MREAEADPTRFRIEERVDRRSFVEFVQALTPARVEQYLALLTTGGALVPLDAGEDVTATRPGAPR